MRKILFIIMAACSLMMEAVELNTSNRDTNYVKAIIDRSQKVHQAALPGNYSLPEIH